MDDTNLIAEILRNAALSSLEKIGISGSQIQIKSKQAVEESSTHSDQFIARNKRARYNNIKN